ncbi:hypothetical protein FV222_00390 [Methylobacterium sp. WL103]|uniref:hypothetical protein n=1 Tax=Methylobacterium sp. WL103 TaxID=2603891 RepID=UPI0011D6C1FB|nr:hypothetical protein [Methylobacterium sp. WL103]TXN08963.1 hypothetical protein FV222_00390 [Methylobacterium sp. WL103]
MMSDQKQEATAPEWLPKWVVVGWGIATEVLFRCTLRVSLWIITIIVALAPPLYAAGVQPSLDVAAMTDLVNKAGLFRDLFYVTVVIGLIGFCGIVAALFKYERPNRLVSIIYAIGILAFFFFIVYGTLEFARLVTPHGEAQLVPELRVEYDLRILIYSGVMGLVLELVLAFQGE